MSEPGITEKILISTVARFESADPGNTAVAERLRKGITEGKLKDPEWIIKVLSMADHFILTEEKQNEALES